MNTEKVLNKLKIAELLAPKEVKKAMLKIVINNLEAFADSATDLGRTSVITHVIKTCAVKPFRH